MKQKWNRMKYFIKNNKNATIYIAVLVTYTLVMLCVWLVGSKGLTSCSSGSLSSMMKEDSGNETTTESSTEGITTSADIEVE